MVRSAEHTVAVIGGGSSGLAAAALALRLGSRVVVYDKRSVAELGAHASELAANGAEFRNWDQVGELGPSYALAVISPGVPSFPELERAMSQGLRVVGEVEYAVRHLAHPAPIVAVGGTNGKSTVTSLIAHAKQLHGARTFAGGNLGEPLANHTDAEFDCVVLEVSSYQMERVETFRPRVNLLLNITPDHLDRYPSILEYAAAKGNAFVQQQLGDTAVIPFADPVCLAQAQRGKAQIVTFGAALGATVQIEADAILDTRTGQRYLRSAIALQGGHNMLNVAAAICALGALDVAPLQIRDALTSFRGLPHRVEYVGEYGGIRYYDDSKGTNVGAAVTALLGLTEAKAVLIVGGRDKGGSYEPLTAALEAKGRAVVLIGEARALLAKAFDGRVATAHATSMSEAVAFATALAHPGDAVLLSPACSSFDMFRDYKERGDAFASAARALGAAQ